MNPSHTGSFLTFAGSIFVSYLSRRNSGGFPRWSTSWNSGPMDWWNVGVMEYWVSKTKKRYFRFRTASLEDHFAEAQGKVFLAFSLKFAAGERSSNLFQGNIYPWIQYSIIPILQMKHFIIPILQKITLMENGVDQILRRLPPSHPLAIDPNSGKIE